MTSVVVPVLFARGTPQATAYYTTRHGGVSEGAFASLNCGFSAGDDPRAVRENRRRALSVQGHDPAALTIGGQVHGVNVAQVSEKERGRGALDPKTVLQETDGLLTAEPDTPIGITTADCMPVFLYADDPGVVGAVHAGWRGTLGGILEVALTAMTETWSVRPEGIQVAFGPGICPNCFEIREDVATEAAAHPMTGDLLKKKDTEHWTLDLRGHLVKQCVELGVSEDNVSGQSPCSICENDTYFSYRAEGPKSGRTLSVIGLRSA